MVFENFWLLTSLKFQVWILLDFSFILSLFSLADIVEYKFDMRYKIDIIFECFFSCKERIFIIVTIQVVLILSVTRWNSMRDFFFLRFDKRILEYDEYMFELIHFIFNAWSKTFNDFYFKNLFRLFENNFCFVKIFLLPFSRFLSFDEGKCCRVSFLAFVNSSS